MAEIEKIIPFLIYWEAGVENRNIDNAALFAKAVAKGMVNDPADLGGATVVGVTIATYSDYCRRKGRGRPSVSDLARLEYADWLDILKTMFWDRWQADLINDQRVAHMLVDWVWTSGNYGIKLPQQMLGVKADGIVGPKTLAAVNSREPSELFLQLKVSRSAYFERICRQRPTNRRFLNGWLCRLNAI